MSRQTYSWEKPKKIKSSEGSVADEFLSGFFTRIILTSFLASPVVLALIYFAIRRDDINLQEANTILAGITFYSFAFGFILIEQFNEWWRLMATNFFILIALVLFFIMYGIDDTNDASALLLTAAIITIGVFIFVTFYRRYFITYSSDEGMLKAPTLSNYIAKLDRFMGMQGYQKMSDGNKDHVRGFRKSLLKMYKEMVDPTKEQDYRDPSKPAYRNYLQLLDHVDSNVFGRYKYKENNDSSPIIDEFIARDGTISTKNQFIDTFTTDFNIHDYYKNRECEAKLMRGRRNQPQRGRGGAGGGGMPGFRS
jgi:hypothetical protein